MARPPLPDRRGPRGPSALGLAVSVLALSAASGCRTAGTGLWGAPVVRGQSPAAADAPPPASARAAPAADGRGLSSIARNRREDEFDEADVKFPNIFEEPGERYGLSPDEYDPFLFPWAVNLIHEDLFLLEADPRQARERRLRRSARVNIRDPDPDTANFPNGAYTLPKGRVYLETSPVGFFGPSRVNPQTYSWEYLFRYGLTHNLEFRLFSNGLTATSGRHATTGVSPLAFDFKINFWEENRKYLIPAAGVEIYINTTFGSRAFNGGTQPSINLLFDHTLPFEVNFEHNFSLTGRQGVLGQSNYEFGYSWSFQREVVPDLDVFIHGFYNASSLPRLPGLSIGGLPGIAGQPQALGPHPTAVVVGVGPIWTVNNRLSVFGSYNVGFTKISPATIAQLGFAVAF